MVAPWRQDLWRLIRNTPHLHWQLLTKRADNIRPNLPSDWGEGGYPNVWLGVSVESIDHHGRIDELRKIPAVVRYVSYEPALGPIGGANLDGIDWVICGGESGPNYREMPLEWAREARDLCRRSGVAYFFKQSSARFTERGILLDGQIVREYPTPRAVSRD